MRRLLAAATGFLLACGGAADSLAVRQDTSALESTASDRLVPLEPPKEVDTDALHWEVVWTREGPVLQLVADPVEERFFVPVEPTTEGPVTPPPPCPACG